MVSKQQSAKRQSEVAERQPVERKPDPKVEAPEFVWISKGYDPRLPNPKRVRERQKEDDS